MTETLTITQRAKKMAMRLDRVADWPPGSVSEHAADILREIAAAHEALCTERNDALAVVTTAEQRTVNAEAALEAMTRERDDFQRRSIDMHRRVTELEGGAAYRWAVKLREQFRSERDSLAAEVAALREALEDLIGATDGMAMAVNCGMADASIDRARNALATRKERAQ